MAWLFEYANVCGGNAIQLVTGGWCRVPHSGAALAAAAAASLRAQTTAWAAVVQEAVHRLDACPAATGIR